MPTIRIMESWLKGGVVFAPSFSVPVEFVAVGGANAGKMMDILGGSRSLLLLLPLLAFPPFRRPAPPKRLGGGNRK
jgi:hypothetical protein